MKPLKEVIRIKQELERKLIYNSKVSAIDVSTPGEKNRQGKNEYIIRILVNRPEVSHKELGISKSFKGLPTVIEYRKIELH
jgi:hypothetical protein